MLTARDSSAALCQVFDSIFMDVPMSKVKFDATTEREYILNFKKLQGMSDTGVPVPPHATDE